MYIDNELILMQDKDTGDHAYSNVIDLGSTGGWVHPLQFDVKLTKGLTSGKVDCIDLFSADNKEMSGSKQEFSFFIPASIDQSHPTTLGQFFVPIKPGNRYIKLTVHGKSGEKPTGGKLFASIVNGTAVGY